MAGITTSQRAELIVTDGENQLPILSGSVTVAGGDPTCIGWSPLYGNGQLDVIGEHAGTTTITVTLGQSVGTLEVTVTEAEPGTLVVTLGTPRPK